VAKVDQFSVKENSWKSLPDLVIARSNSSGCIIGNSLYIFGGYSSETGSLQSIEKLNFMTEESKFTLIDMILPIGLFDIGIVPTENSHRVMLLGGHFSTENPALAQRLLFTSYNEKLENMISGENDK
jgi:hypothetical protein